MDNMKIIDAICGKGFGSMERAIKYEKMGFARFCGNQWNEDWEWDREMLRKLTPEVLEDIYNGN